MFSNPFTTSSAVEASVIIPFSIRYSDGDLPPAIFGCLNFFFWLGLNLKVVSINCSANSWFLTVGSFTLPICFLATCHALPNPKNEDNSFHHLNISVNAGDTLLSSSNILAVSNAFCPVSVEAAFLISASNFFI